MPLSIENSSVPGTPTSQNTESQHSLSPLDSTFATGSSASPGDGAVREISAAQQQPIAAVSAVTSIRNGDLPNGQQTFQDFKTLPISHISNSYLWDGIDNTVQAPSVQPVNGLDSSLSPQEPFVPVRQVQPLSSLESSVSPRENIAPVRHDSADSSSEVSDQGRAKADKADAPESTRTRTTDSAKVRHNIVERRYRENINAQVDVLRDSIVATMQVKDEQNGTSSSRLGADELKRLTKAAVIAAATQQIKRARTENEQLLDEHRALQSQIKELEKLVKCGDCPIMGLGKFLINIRSNNGSALTSKSSCRHGSRIFSFLAALPPTSLRLVNYLLFWDVWSFKVRMPVA